MTPLNYLTLLLPFLSTITLAQPSTEKHQVRKRGRCTRKNKQHHQFAPSLNGTASAQNENGTLHLDPAQHAVNGGNGTASVKPSPAASTTNVASGDAAIVKPSQSANVGTGTGAALNTNATSNAEVSPSTSASLQNSGSRPDHRPYGPSASTSGKTTVPLAVLAPTGAASPTATTATTAAAASPAVAQNGTEPATGSLSQEAELFVTLHNDFRRQYSAPAVTWDPTLASFAASYAPICKMTHSSGPYGENLAGGAGGGYNINSAFEAWASEAQYYDWSKPGVLDARDESGNEVGLGHFTQVVWKGTERVGCAKVGCADGTLFTGYGTSVFVVCEYAPAGNVYMSGDSSNSLFRENVGTKI